MFTQVLEKYRIDYYGNGNMETTADQVCEKLGRILKTLSKDHGVRFEGGRFVGLTAPVLMDWYADLTASGKKMTTKNTYVALLNPFLRWAVKRQMLVKKTNAYDPEEIPIYEILEIKKLPKEESIHEENRKKKSFTKDELIALMKSINGRNAVRNRAILALFLYSGIRESELCSLTLSSVLDQPRGTIYLKRKGGIWKHTEVAEAFYPYLDAYLATRDDLSIKDHALFEAQTGGHLSRKQIWKMFNEYEKKIGLTSGVHIFRHTVISNIDKNYSAGAARDIANHSSLVVTNRYDHTTPQERAEAINCLDWNEEI